MVDFANARVRGEIVREREIAEAIEHDAGGRVHRGRDTPLARPSDVLFPPSWLSMMREILELPVAPWTAPPAVAGEIDTERRLPDSRGGGAALLPVTADANEAG
jgi:hypothetical protein